jgi:hypothetical protein
MKLLKFRRYRFQLVDRTSEFDDLRTIIADDCVIEPHDDRTDMCVSIPVRSVISAAVGPAIEIGPFTLDTSDVVKLHNTISDHINSFPTEFTVRPE